MDFMSAKTALKVATEKAESKRLDSFSRVFGKISEACREGQTSIQIIISTDDEEMLSEKGYDISPLKGTSLPRTVSWDKTPE